MKPNMFRQPVTILVGLGFPTEVRSVMEACRHLAEWPASFRDTAHSVAMKACQAALEGKIEAETARGLFAAFVAKHDLKRKFRLGIAYPELAARMTANPVQARS